MIDRRYLHVHDPDRHPDLWRGDIDLGDGETLNITITHEGIIMDHYVGEIAEVVSTVGMTFDEWTDWMRREG